MSGHDLPELVRIDLNKDGSVTLLLTRPSQKLARIDFGAPNTGTFYALVQIGVALPSEGHPEKLGFQLSAGAGERLFLEVKTVEGLEWMSRILAHLKRPQPTPPGSPAPSIARGPFPARQARQLGASL